MKTIISDTITYKKLDFDLTNKYVESTKKQLESLKNNLYNTLQFKKKKNIQGFVLHPRFIRLEPFLSSPVSKLGKWLSVALRPLSGRQKSYSRNLTDVTNKLNEVYIGGEFNSL